MTGETPLEAAALANRDTPLHVTRTAFERNDWRVGSYPRLDHPDLADIVTELIRLAHETIESSAGEIYDTREIGHRLIQNRSVAYDVRLALAQKDLRTYLHPCYYVETAMRSSDPALVRQLTADVLEKRNSVALHNDLRLRRYREGLLCEAAANPAADRATFEMLAEMEHVEVDRALCSNPNLPASLYRQIAPLHVYRTFRTGHLDALAYLEEGRTWSSGEQPLGRWLWHYRSGSQELLKHPANSTVDLTELDDGDLVMVDRYLHPYEREAVFGPRRWVSVRLPESPVPIRYRGYGHGALPEDAARYLRHVGRAILTDWPHLARIHHQTLADPLRELATYQAATRRRAAELAHEALSAGVPRRDVARQLDLKVAELDQLLTAYDPPADRFEQRSGEPSGELTFTPDNEHITIRLTDPPELDQAQQDHEVS